MKTSLLQLDILKTLVERPEVLGHYLGYDHLTQLHGEWIKDVWATAAEDFLLMAHRNSYKTTAVIVVGIIWYLLFHPEDTILLVRKTYDGARETLGEIRQHYAGEKMRSLYATLQVPNFRLAVDKEESIRLPTKHGVTKEDNVSISGIAGRGVTGQHYDRVHMDDVVTELDRDSRVERQRTKRFYHNLKSVVKMGGIITATGTPWHQADLYTEMQNVKRYPLGSIAIDGVDAEYTKNMLRTLTPSHFASQYMLQHVAEKNKLFADIKISANFPSGTTYAHLDAAYGGRDTTALSIIAIGSNCITVAGKVFTGHVQKCYDEIKATMLKYAATKIWLEKNADKGLVRRDLQALGLTSIGYHEKTNKHVKIASYLFRYWKDIVFYKATDAEYLEQIENYSEQAEFDDAPDSLASLLRCEGWRYEKMKQSPSTPLQAKEVAQLPAQEKTKLKDSWHDAFSRGIRY